MAEAAAAASKRGNVYWFDPKKLVIVGLDTEDGPEHELWDERIRLPLDEPMILNLMAVGIKETVLVRNSERGAEVVDGRRRVMHAREANARLKKLGEEPVLVPALIEQGDETHVQSVSIALNEIRRDDDVVVKAEKCLRLLHRNGGDRKKAAIAFGVSEACIKNWVKIAELAAPVKKAVAAGKISASAATELHGLEREKQVAKLEKLTGRAQAQGKKRASATSAKRAAGKIVAVPRRVLMKLVDDEKLSAAVEAEVIFGIKLALGTHVPPVNSRLGKLLQQAGFKYN